MRNCPVISLALITLTASLSAAAAVAQQVPAPSATSASGTARDVVLPVTVRDKHGALVPGLKATDFTLSDEGKPQTIKSFTQQTEQPLRIGILVDTSRPMSGALETERKAVDKFVDDVLPAEAGGKSDQAFLIHFDREVELLQDFTSAREKLHHELDDMGATRPSQNDSQGPETTGEDRDSRPRSSRAGDQLYDAIYLASNELMGPKDGRKALIVFSDGMDRGSKDRMPEAIDAADRAGVEVYTIYFKGEQERSESSGFPGSRRGGGFPGGGGGYPGGGGGYPGGGGRRGGPEPKSDTGVDGKKIMQQISTRTGGHAYEAKKKEDLEQIYKLISEEIHGQYVMTFTPDKVENDGSFHKVALKPNKDDLIVVTREGYFAPDSSK